nr:glycosyltransferase family 2 protein [uncultured Blautia sp.]
MNPIISVIIPVYNAEKYIKRCLESVFAQKYTNIEIIVINDGSTDNSDKVIRNCICEKVKYILLEKNTGQSNARNIGINYCTGEWLLYLDADDEIAAETIGNIYEEVKRADADLAIFGYYRKRKKKIIRESVNVDEGEYSSRELLKLLYDAYPVQWLSCIGNKLYSTNIIKKNNIRFSDKFKYNEDLGFILDYLHYVKKIITKKDEYYCYNYTLGSTQNKNFYRPGSIETITVTREYLKEALEKNLLWDEKQAEFSYSMTEMYFGSLLNRWKSYKDFVEIYQKIKLTDKYSDKVNLKAKFGIISFFTVLLKKDRIVVLYIYIKLLEAAKELKQINVYIYNKCFLHNYK